MNRPRDDAPPAGSPATTHPVPGDSPEPDVSALADPSSVPVSRPDADRSKIRHSRFRSFVQLVRSVVDVDPQAVESAARQLGESRRWLAPLAWAAGTAVLMVNGIKVLVINWRLSLIQLLPAAWIWLATWDLKRHVLRGGSFRHAPLLALVALSIVIMLCSIAAYWCNVVFAIAIDGPSPPKIAPAMRHTSSYHRVILFWGVTVGAALILAAVVIPRLGRIWLFAAVLSAVIGVMMVSFVSVPARIIGVRKQRLPPKEAVGRAAAGSALSAVAMSPGFLLDRIGLILLGTPGLHILGFAMLSVGAALYAAGMSSVKVVKLSMKLSTTPDSVQASNP